MKKRRLMVIPILTIGVLSLSVLSYAFASNKHIENTLTSKLDGFEKPDSWIIKFSGLKDPKWLKEEGGFPEKSANPDPSTDGKNTKTSTPPAKNTAKSGDEKWIKWIDVSTYSPYKQSVLLPQGIKEKERKDEKTILGIKSSWIKKAANWVSIEPKDPIYTPIDPVAISLWVWGSSYNYTLTLIVENSEGYYYNLYLGNLNYDGWRLLSVDIPSFAYPKKKHNLDTRLKIIRLQVNTNPGADPKGFYTYFDYMQVQHRIDFLGNTKKIGLSAVKW